MYRRYQGLWWAVLFMIVVLTAWASLGYYLLVKTAECNVPIGPELPIWPDLLPCVTPNEMGDILAGFFAPAAFFVLTGAVFLQSLELKAQRDELEETRGVFIEQNRLIEAQTRAAEASTALFQVQNNLLTLQEERLAARAADEECAEALEQLADHLRRELIYKSWQGSKSDDVYRPFAVSPAGGDTVDFLRGFYDTASAPHVDRGLPPPYRVEPAFEPALRRAHMLTTRVLVLSELCGLDRKASIETMRLRELAYLFADRINNYLIGQMTDS
ncbi:hypothetical protein B9J07_18060 [Sinorhizobium sp. LM21]|nr:hypothetical protein B9J07_18060 [Sinorhizobium sp. LM21]